MKKKFVNASIIAATAAAAVVVPVASNASANEVTVTIDKVGLKAIDGSVIVVSKNDYVDIFFAVTQNESVTANLQALIEKLAVVNGAPVITDVIFGDKAISKDAYVELWLNDVDNGETTKITADELADTEATVLPENSTEYKDGEYTPVNPNPTPEENPIETFFYNLVA